MTIGQLLGGRALSLYANYPGLASPAPDVQFPSWIEDDAQTIRFSILPGTKATRITGPVVNPATGPSARLQLWVFILKLETESR